MVYVFGINLPVVEVLFIAIILFIVGLGFMIWQIIQVKRHMSVLERTTREIRQYEVQEESQVARLEIDVKNFETDEASMFVARVVPTVSKLENFAMAQLFKGMVPGKVVDTLVMKKVEKDLAIRVVNQVGYYLNYYHKLPKAKHDAQHTIVSNIQMPTGKNVPKMPELVVKK